MATPDTHLSLFTFGHGLLPRGDMARLLTGAGIAALVDIRSYPGSRANPDAGREAMARWLPAAGVDYRWEPRLGGRRHLRKDDVSPDTWWTVAAFRAYAAHTRTAEFTDALDELLDAARAQPMVIMCSESVWWRCHRRVVADVVELAHGWHVQHLMHTGKLAPHRVAAGARLDHDTVIWDG